MGEVKPKTWKDACQACPGPKTLKETGLLAFKGLCMGTADIIPGVSGGTIALITGIYKDLLMAIKSINTKAVKSILTLKLKDAVAEIHIRFLIVLLAGISLGIITLSRVMHYLLHHHPIHTWSLFFGLIAASIIIVGKKVKWTYGTLISFIAGLVFGFVVVGLIPVSTPEQLWFIFLSGFIAICAMILPGLSGAFFLLILGKYEYITGALKNPFTSSNIIIITVFCAGCFCGLLGFSRILNYLLSKWYVLTLAFLTGLMAGSLRKIWPWKEVLETRIIRDKLHVLREQNILPDFATVDFFLAVALMITGFILILILDKVSQTSKKDLF